ncbi:interleukin-7 receptor subunit alpha [Brienomyrus brachyistius]|uniref:interleukin-7 receptor subunit alpha n=1 Tax=Brienomyrus brachyistius TaxID=42636 RepID=UPI0020B1D929|nr:interleukin-7 receptor subunit alpha [Brienomyrus brachyistius]XP_048876259.1 interleukin-7 receptor subunit alpha [Brienomyrus brachyistius]XP_048876260.1 interleukin-7 receptor subunit alpha [Brienomyrus brachyistius]
MAQSCWAALFIFPLLVQAQSGSDDEEPYVHCWSSVTMENTLLFCQVDEDMLTELKNATLCKELPKAPVINQDCKTIMTRDDNITFPNLSPLLKYRLKIQFQTREPFSKTYELKKIIKPNTPMVNTTFVAKEWKAIVSIETGYKNDILENALTREVKIKGRNATYVVDQNELHIESREVLRENTQYCVKARCKPNNNYFDGYWSDWSHWSKFHTPKEHQADQLHIYIVMGALLLLLMIAGVMVRHWYKDIKLIIWPIIPNPKHTLVQGYKPNKGPPVSFHPESFNDNCIQLIDQVEERRVTPDSPDLVGSYEVRRHSSGQRTMGPILRNSTANTGENHPMLQNKGKVEEDGLGTGRQMSASGITRNSGTSGRSEANSNNNVPVPRRDEAYVTMSSFYKTQ